MSATEDIAKTRKELEKARKEIYRLQAARDTQSAKVDEILAWFSDAGFDMKKDLSKQIIEMQNGVDQLIEDLQEELESA